MRYALKLQRYNFRIFYKSGKHHHDADVLSRYPQVESSQEDEDDVDEDNDFLTGLCMAVVQEENELRDKQREDPKLRILMDRMEHMVSLSKRDCSKFSLYRITEGVLYRLVKRPFKDEYNIVVPGSMYNNVCRANHDEVMSGHPMRRELINAS